MALSATGLVSSAARVLSASVLANSWLWASLHCALCTIGKAAGRDIVPFQINPDTFDLDTDLLRDRESDTIMARRIQAPSI